MAGDQVEVIQRNDAWVSVLAPEETEQHSEPEQGMSQDREAVSGEGAMTSRRSGRSRSPARWVWRGLLAAALIVGIGAIVVGTTAAFDRYLPELGDARSVDGEPPAIFVQTDSASNVVERVAGEAIEQVSSWPTILIAPVSLAALLGLFLGWVRWRWGRARTAERQARQLEAETQRLLAQDLEKSMRLDTLQVRFRDTRNELAQLTDELDRAGSAAHANQDLRAAIESKSLEAGRLATDLEDALAERDHLENQVDQLKADLAHVTEQSSEALDALSRLNAADDLVEQQRLKISSLENHLDQVRRRVAELADEARSAAQLRSAWGQAEGMIADLTEQLNQTERDQQVYQPATAEAILGNPSRVAELEDLLNEAAEVIESSQEQLRQTRYQVRELDAALARAEARDGAWQTEVELLTTEIEQAALLIADLQELPERERHSKLMLAEMRSALDAERDRSASLETQLRVVNARAHRLESHLLGDRPGGEHVLDLTENANAPAA
ncbi:MAG: hypothetical protein ACN4GZ_03780 [Acidimicrobiales bacterium]